MADEADLPFKAREVATKFGAFQVISSPAAIEVKREQVIEYLGALLDQEAAMANLEGALAIKDLIAQLSRGEEPVAKPFPSGRKLRTDRGAAAKTFSIKSEGTRELAFEFDVASAGETNRQAIRCEIGGAADNSGDRGLHYQLIDPGGKVAKRGFLESADTLTISHETELSGRWRLLIEDDDTSFEGDSPGNNGTVRVRVSPVGHQLAGHGGAVAGDR